MIIDQKYGLSPVQRQGIIQVNDLWLEYDWQAF